ncbi:MAG: DUF21 domain-containing protein [Planctomycetales bacterium]|nr:DUF21 domain-containing protein [Planctomycetales bacterium]NIM07855.1 DUF21 domain-containing protein [Planctomycetales bacterium]NIN07344.1 DUF21 domain-containing protein [Planctomycetales bacterium]NIN76447.1 DUF21 domain-containing protein [Planctomycetales bacterium]NIO35388.1 DUF21 domain-containing protein [Planctomycetales bacterium]
MIWLSILLCLVGLALSAFFSGSETGFYRVPRVRLQIEAHEGNRLSRALLWLTNHPSVFVATSLVGNNVANYLTSLAIVMAVGYVYAGSGVTAEMLAPIVLAPLLFVYGELLPKNIFFYRPHGLLRACGPLFLLCVLLFVPVSILLWTASWLLEQLAGQSPQKLHGQLARKELKRVLEEGQEAGILWPSQRALAQGIFALADQPVEAFATTLAEVPAVSEKASSAEVLQVARQNQVSALPVHRPGAEGNFIGYLKVADVYLGETSPRQRIRPLVEIPQQATHLAALMTLQSANQWLARLVNQAGKTVAIVTVDQLYEPLFRADG